MQPALIATEGSLQSGNGAGEGAALLVPQQQLEAAEALLRRSK